MTRLKRLKSLLWDVHNALQNTEAEIEAINREIENYNRDLKFLEEDRLGYKNQIERIEQDIAGCDS